MSYHRRFSNPEKPSPRVLIALCEQAEQEVTGFKRLAEVTEMKLSSASQLARELKASGLIDWEKSGRQVARIFITEAGKQAVNHLFSKGPIPAPATPHRPPRAVKVPPRAVKVPPRGLRPVSITAPVKANPSSLEAENLRLTRLLAEKNEELQALQRKLEGRMMDREDAKELIAEYLESAVVMGPEALFELIPQPVVTFITVRILREIKATRSKSATGG